MLMYCITRITYYFNLFVNRLFFSQVKYRITFLSLISPSQNIINVKPLVNKKNIAWKRFLNPSKIAVMTNGRGTHGWHVIFNRSRRNWFRPQLRPGNGEIDKIYIMARRKGQQRRVSKLFIDHLTHSLS